MKSKFRDLNALCRVSVKFILFDASAVYFVVLIISYCLTSIILFFPVTHHGNGSELKENQKLNSGLNFF